MNKEADLFIFSEKNIAVLLDGKIIEIGGEDAWMIIKLFRALHCRKKYVKEIAGLLGRKNVTDDLRESIAELKDLKIIVEVKKSYVSGDNCSIRPFSVFPLQNDIWCFRNREKIYCFLASAYKEAKQKMENILLSCADEDDLDLLLRTNKQKTDCLARQFYLPLREIPTLSNPLRKGDLVIFDMKKNKRRYIKGSFSSNEGLGFWEELEKRAVGKTRIVPSLRKVRDNGLPFKRRKVAYLSFHKLTELDDKITDFQIGVDEEVEVAKGKAIMEAIERYCGRKTSGGNLTFASFAKMDSNVVINPKELWNFSDRQFSKGWLKDISPFDQNETIPWIKVKNVLGGSDKYAPLSFMTYATKMPGDYPFNFRANSNGMAAHTSLDEAIKKGALEIIERDAILIYWLNKISPKQIDLDGCKEEVGILADNLEKMGYKLHLADLTLDTVPVVMAMAFGEKSELPFFCGAAASESKIGAIGKAVEELEFTIWSRIKYIRDTKKKVRTITLETISEPVDHEALYLKPEMIEHLRFLFKGESYQISKDELFRKTDLYSTLSAKKLELYSLDMTVKEVEDLNLGIKVIKSIIPGFIPITFGYGKEPLGMKRVYDIPIKLGLKNKTITEGELVDNYLPHFFP